MASAIALNKPSGGQLILSPEDGTSTETISIPSTGYATHSEALAGSFRQVKSVQLLDSSTSSADGWVSFLSLNFDNPVKVGSTILVFSSGIVSVGPGADNWGSGCSIFVDSTNLVGNDAWHGAVDFEGQNWGSHFHLTGQTTATTTNPTIALKGNRVNWTSGSSWPWVGVGYNQQSYGKVATYLMAIEVEAA